MRKDTLVILIAGACLFVFLSTAKKTTLSAIFRGVRGVYRFVRQIVLRGWRSSIVVRVRRHATAFDQAVLDVANLWMDLWFDQPKRWPPPSLRWIPRVLKRRRVLMRRLHEIAAKLSIPVHVVGAAQLGKNVLGRYNYGSMLPQINLLDVRQDDPWVLAHELGHHFAISFKNDKREAAADEEARKLVESAVGREAHAWLRYLARDRLPADGYVRATLVGGPSVFGSLFLLGIVLTAVHVGIGSFLTMAGVFNFWAFMMFSAGGQKKRVDPYEVPRSYSASTTVPNAATAKRISRLEKLRALRDDPNAFPGERRNARAEISRMQRKR